MENLFVNAAFNESNKTLTENGANAFVSTTNDLVDLFSCIGSIRCRSDQEIERKFQLAFGNDPLLATKMAFYARNVRGGLGERKTFRVILSYMARMAPDIVEKNLYLIPTFGRWDDLFALIKTPVENSMWDFIGMQLSQDVMNYQLGNSISLLAKWLKSVNTSSASSKALGRLTAKKLGIKESHYRKLLSILRSYIDVTEVKMSNGEWDKIKFEQVPSKAMNNYMNSFRKHTPDAFNEYISEVQKGEKSIHAATLYPYDILEKVGLIDNYHNRYFKIRYDAALEEQWKALPNYVDEPANFLVMADTSGSMYGRPLCTSVGLAIYFAERNFGAFKDLFLTFSSIPSFVHLKGDTLQAKVGCVPSIVDNTNLAAAFDLVLKTALDNNVPQSDLPKSIIVISDGEIDYFSRSGSAWSFLEEMERRYNSHGYELPKVVMWNVESRGDRVLDTIKNPKIQFISGSSPSAFRSLIKGANLTAYELMLEVLNDPMYDCISI